MFAQILLNLKKNYVSIAVKVFNNMFLLKLKMFSSLYMYLKVKIKSWP